MTSEFDLIRQLAPFLADGTTPGVAIGHGDDAAVVDVGDSPVCIAVDVVVDEVHVRRDVCSLEDIGWKAVAVNVSDLAAMGASPVAAVVGLCRPPDLAAEEVTGLYQGMNQACERYGLRLVGGDTVRADTLAVSVTIIGKPVAHDPVTRAGAQPGDAVVLVGALGASAAALALLMADAPVSADLLAAYRRPVALLNAGQQLAADGARAMIDVSDGLGADAGHIAAASQVGLHINADALPIADGVVAAAAHTGHDPLELACGGGEDFALLAAVPAPQAAAAVAAAAEADGVTGAIIGDVVPEAGVVLVDPNGEHRRLEGVGYDHYTQQ